MAHDLLLALDTSTRCMGLALYDGAAVLAESCWATSDHHTVELAPALEETLRRCGTPMSRVTALGVAIGPGSFTGLRIGLALAKGMALSRRLPIVGIPTLDITAAGMPKSPLPLVAVLQAGRGRLAAGRYGFEAGRWKATSSVQVLTAQALHDQITEPAVVCGELSAAERQLLGQNPNLKLAEPPLCVRRPALLAALAWERWQMGQTDDPATLAPTYLHIGDPIPA